MPDEVKIILGDGRVVTVRQPDGETFIFLDPATGDEDFRLVIDGERAQVLPPPTLGPERMEDWERQMKDVAACIADAEHDARDAGADAAQRYLRWVATCRHG